MISPSWAEWRVLELDTVLGTLESLPSGADGCAIGPLTLCAQLSAVLLYTLHENALEDGVESDLENHVDFFEKCLRLYLANLVDRAKEG